MDSQGNILKGQERTSSLKELNPLFPSDTLKVGSLLKLDTKKLNRDESEDLINYREQKQ